VRETHESAQPWVAEGIARRTWYLRRAKAGLRTEKRGVRDKNAMCFFRAKFATLEAVRARAKITGKTPSAVIRDVVERAVASWED
jgi:hypothetical protein